jgi:hypothetical protein
LQEIQRDLADIKGQLSGLRDDQQGLDTKLDGNTLILNFLAGLIGDHARRLDALEDNGEPAE